MPVVQDLQAFATPTEALVSGLVCVWQTVADCTPRVRRRSPQGRKSAVLDA